MLWEAADRKTIETEDGPEVAASGPGCDRTEMDEWAEMICPTLLRRHVLPGWAAK